MRAILSALVGSHGRYKALYKCPFTLLYFTRDLIAAIAWIALLTVRPGGVVVRALDSRLKRSQVRLPAVPFSGNNLGQVVHTHVHLSPSGII